MLRDRKQLCAVAAGEQKISALTRTAATLSDLGEAPESHTEQIGRPMARVTEPVSAGLGRSNLSIARGLGSVVSSRSGVWGTAQAEIKFSAF